MHVFSYWKRTFEPQHTPQADRGERLLYVPAIEPVGNLPYELAGLLPNREHKKDLMALIDNLPDNRLGERAVVGVFAADPFINCKQIAMHLTSKGYDQVSNIPPVAGYGPEFLATMDNVQSGRVREQRAMAQMKELGLTIYPAVADLEGLDTALAWEPPFLWITPSFEMVRDDGLDTEALLALCAQVAARTDIPLVLISGQTGMTSTEAQKAGASGILNG